MSQVSRSTPLFVDTNAFVAVFNEDDTHHDAATELLDGIGAGEYAYGPLYTSRYVLSETATTLLYGVGHAEAVEAVATVRDSSSINLIDVDPHRFDVTVKQFEQYDDQSISFIDHMNATLAEEYDISHIFAFDDDFATLGLTRVPVDTGEV
ncbi:putative ribonuclease VapC protein [Halorhabdus tiamatea SARL4B]|uniref:PilT domain protein n=1 Tax=Halorhabdus tiamatea SARL4B TaxID=1033806 RepID=F7PF47_9EURY|nr:PIN domain-containing protein [Halorhabdus tiamatea]ERJ06037.1 putative ribonuclease VapC protein [Halorhabdus tiamatea SARL4B]CCQ34402.1 PilT domain protein [Halorhabdus tiamatea SARL4B]